MKLTRLLSMIFLCALPFCSQAEGAFPSRPITLVVAFPPGGGVDTVGRLIARGMAEKLGQPIIVDNRAGAGGQIGTGYVSRRAAPDGYTLLMGSPSAVTAGPALFSNLSYDPSRDLAAVSQAVTVPNLLVVNPSFPAKTLPDLIALAKKEPNKVTYGTTGVGSSQHLAGELLGHMAHVKMLHVPYKGTAAATTDTISGQVNFSIGDPTVVPYIKSGQLRVIGITTVKRSRALPDYPTFAEQGVTGYDAGNWYGFLAPAQTPANVVAILNQAIAYALAKPDVQQRLLEMGMDPAPSSPENFKKFLTEDAMRWKNLVEVTGIKPE